MDKQIDMRSVFVNELARMMDEDDRIVIVDADLAKAMGTLGLYKNYREKIFHKVIHPQTT